MRIQPFLKIFKRDQIHLYTGRNRAFSSYVSGLDKELPWNALLHLPEERGFRDQSQFKLEGGVEEKLFFIPNFFQTPTNSTYVF